MKTGGTSGVAGLLSVSVIAGRFEMNWSDYLLRLVAARGGGSMTCKFIGIFDSVSILDDRALTIAASDCAAAGNASEADDSRPLARAPDTPSSTR